MFGFRDSSTGRVTVEIAFTDASVDLQGRRPHFREQLAEVESTCGVGFARMNQVHGRDVVVVDRPELDADTVPASADALVTNTPGVGLMVRVADCVPVLLADPVTGVLGAAHAGREGIAVNVVGACLEAMRELGAEQISAWIGPHVCGACYEVPDELRAEVAALVPEAYADSRWGTASLDLGAAVASQLRIHGIEPTTIAECTLESDRWHSYRRNGAASGRQAGLVWSP